MTEMIYMMTAILISDFIYLVALLASLVQAAVVLYYIYNGSNGLSRNQFARHILVSAYCGYEIYLQQFHLFEDLLVIGYLIALIHAMWLSNNYHIRPVVGRKLTLGDTQPVHRRSRTGTIEAILDRVDGKIVDKPQ